MSSKPISGRISPTILKPNPIKNLSQKGNAKSSQNSDPITSMNNQRINTSHSRQRVFQFPKTPYQSNSWKTGKYYTNSGIYNVNFTKTNSYTTLPSNTSRTESRNSNLSQNFSSASFDLPRIQEKSYHVNKESTEGWNPLVRKNSMINYHSSDYNPITLASVPPRPPTTTTSHRQGGFCEYLDHCKLNNKKLDSNYQETLKANPRAFFKKSGEFTEHNVNCLKLGGIGPFYTPPTLLKNK